MHDFRASDMSEAQIRDGLSILKLDGNHPPISRPVQEDQQPKGPVVHYVIRLSNKTQDSRTLGID